MAKIAYGVATFVLITINVLFLICGCGLLAFGIIAKTGHYDDLYRIDVNYSSSYSGLSEYQRAELRDFVEYAPISLIVFGGVIIIVSLLGCCGACLHSRTLLGFYFTFVLLVFLGEIGLCIWAAVSRNDFSEDIINATYSEESSIYHSICPDYCPMDNGSAPPPQACIDCIKAQAKRDTLIVFIILFGVAGIELIILISTCVLIEYIKKKEKQLEEVAFKEYQGQRVYRNL